MADGLRIRRKRGRLAQAQQQAAQDKGRHTRCQRRAKTGQTPDERPDSPDSFDAKPIEENADRKLRQCIRPVERPQQIAEPDGRDSEVGVQGIISYGNVDPVDVVDQHAYPQQNGYSPALWVRCPRL